jgi:uncharacterized protein (TIGR00369 family)
MENEHEIPAGFERHTRRSGLTDPWEPVYAASTATTFSLGLRAGAPHVNSRGFVHGGLLSALADNAMGLSCARQLQNISGLVTISLTIDFLGTAHSGHWVQVRATPTRVGRSLCFAGADIYSDDQPCATATAVFKVQTTSAKESGK